MLSWSQKFPAYLDVYSNWNSQVLSSRNIMDWKYISKNYRLGHENKVTQQIKEEKEEFTNARSTASHCFFFSGSPYFHKLIVTPLLKTYLFNKSSFINTKWNTYPNLFPQGSGTYKGKRWGGRSIEKTEWVGDSPVSLCIR